MFAEFLHPELVLFGEFLNPNKVIKHNTQLKDDQIIVHQQINRISSDPQKQLQMRKLQELIYRQQQQQYNQQEQQNYHRQLHQEQLYKLNPDNEQESDDYEDDSKEEVNPYDQEYYGFNIQRQYSPEQLLTLMVHGSLENSPVKSREVPFSKQSPKKKPEDKTGVPQGEEDQDDGWQTEQQEQNYVINEMLEEAGGNFAMQL